ncbi:CHASE domain-containing protein [Pelagerythrobacter sp.]|uniref:CHASE domain-containing protein n=1 Tax=Pelagerythrobacter sp. TaxID=2800702 RepID=UPI0035B37A9A
MEFPRAAPVGIFLLVMAVTALSVFAIERGERESEAVMLNDRARAVASALERRGNASSAYLRAGAAMFAAVDRVDEALFDRFVSELQLDFDYRGAEGIGWAQSLRPYELGQFRAGATREEGEEADELILIRPTPTSVSSRVVPITFLRPVTERTRRMLGYDLYSEPVRRAAMDQAESDGRPTASGKLVLQEPGSNGAPGFVIFMPVFRDIGLDRRLRGFVYSPFNAEDFLVSALELADAGERGVRLYDEEASPDRLLAHVEPSSGSGKVVQERILIANRPMVLEVESAGSYSLSPLSMVTLLFGLLVATLLLVVARLVTQQTREDHLKLEWLEEQDSIRNSLTRELNHRVKNTLANVLSIVALTRRRSETLDEFADGLDGRIRAISATHDLLTQSQWGTTPIRAVVEAELAPHARHGEDHFAIAGPDVELAPNDALTLGLAIHELATNAVKYGALSTPEGHVSVRWALEDNIVRMEWVEAGGPVLAGKPKGRGFGLDLIEKIVAHELNQEVELDFPPEGVRCTLRIPVRRPSQFAMRAARREAARRG